MPSSSFQTVINFNNQGCQKLESGDYDKAITSFVTALKEMKVALLEQDASQEQDVEFSSGGILPLPESIKYPGLQQHQASAAADEATHSSREVTSPQFFLHAHPIRMLDDDDDANNQAGSSLFVFSNHADENKSIHTAISIFNLALTLHLQAIETRSEQPDSKVGKLYDLTFQLLSKTIRRYNYRATGNVVVDLLIMALLNNIGLVYRECSSKTSAWEVIFQIMHRYASSEFRHAE